MLFIYQRDGWAIDFSYHETDVGAHIIRETCAN